MKWAEHRSVRTRLAPDLLEIATAVLATNGAGGLPQFTAVAFCTTSRTSWFKLSLNDSGQKTPRTLRRDPRATLFILDPAEASSPSGIVATDLSAGRPP